VALSNSDVSDLLDAIRAGGDLDVVRRSVELVLQALTDTEATEVIGAEPHERTSTRTNQRNGTRDRLLSTKAGDVELEIPKLRVGSFSPAVLERRRRIDRALSSRPRAAPLSKRGGRARPTRRRLLRADALDARVPALSAWPARAACKGMPTRLFFPEKNQPVDPVAIQTCARCRVRDQCLAYALKEDIPHGWSGSLNPQDRKLRPAKSCGYRSMATLSRSSAERPQSELPEGSR